MEKLSFRERRQQWPDRLRRLREASDQRGILEKKYAENFKTASLDQQREKISRIYRQHLSGLEEIMSGAEVSGLHYDFPNELLPQQPFPAQLQGVDMSDAGLERLQRSPLNSFEEILVEAIWGKFYQIQHAPANDPPADLQSYGDRYRQYYTMFALAKIYAATISLDKYRVHQNYEQRSLIGKESQEAHLEKRLSDKGYFAELLICSLFSRFCVCLKEGSEPLSALPTVMLTNPEIDQQLKVDMMLFLEPNGDTSVLTLEDLNLIGLQVSTIRDPEMVDDKQKIFFGASNRINADVSMRSRNYIDASDLDPLGLVKTWNKRGRESTPDLLLRRDQVETYAKKFLNALPPDMSPTATYQNLVAEWCRRYPTSRAAADVRAGRNYGR